jgi:hypothetical protein
MLIQATRNSNAPLIKKIHEYFKKFITIKNTKAPTILDNGAGLATESVRTFGEGINLKLKRKKGFLNVSLSQAML